MMSNKELVLSILKAMGTKDSLELRNKAATMTQTEIIDAEHMVPDFDPSKDYSDYPVGSPVAFEGNIYTLIIPHNASDYPDSNPFNARALWSLCHTKNPEKAVAFVAPNGTSGLYMKDECYKNDAGEIYICNEDNTIYSHEEYPSAWTLHTSQ